MGHSEYDPAAEDRRPWNAGRKIGAKRALKPQQVWAIMFWLDRERQLCDRALFDLAIDHLSASGGRSEEEEMTIIVLSNRAAKLMRLCEIEGFRNIEEILFASITDSVCPAICMTEGCDYTAEMEPDQEHGYCEACGGNTVTSALVLACLI